MNSPSALLAITVIGGLLGVGGTSARQPIHYRFASTRTRTQVVEVRSAHCSPRDPPSGHFGLYGYQGYTFDLNGFDLQFETWNPAAGSWQGRYSTDPTYPRDESGQYFWSGAALDMVCFDAYIIGIGWFHNQVVVMDYGDVNPVPSDCGNGGGGGDGWMDQSPAHGSGGSPQPDARCGDAGGGGGGDVASMVARVLHQLRCMTKGMNDAR